MSKGKSNLSEDSIKKLDAYRKRVDRELTVFFKKQLEESRRIDRTSYQVIKILEEFCLRGGKRIRGALVFYSFLSNVSPKRDRVGSW